MFKQKRKTIYIILLGLIFIFIISIRPILIRLEMKKVHPINNEKSYYTFFYQMKDKSEVLESTFTKDEQGNYCFHAFRSEAKCLNKDEIKILSTKNDQELIAKYIQENYRGDSDADETVYKFDDLNKDGVDDLIIYQKFDDVYNSIVSYINIYSTNDKKYLWEIESLPEESFGKSRSDIQFLNNSNQPTTIVIYDMTLSPSYRFYKSINGIYQQVEPNNQDWHNYWSQVSFKDLIRYRILSNPKNLIIILLIFLMSLFIFIFATSFYLLRLLIKIITRSKSNKL